MAELRALTKAEELAPRITAFMNQVVRLEEVDPFALRSLRREIQELQRSDVLNAGALQCRLQSLMLDDDGLQATLRNMHLNNGSVMARLAEFADGALWLRAARVQGLFQQVIQDRVLPLMQLANFGLRAGAIQALVGALDAAQARNEVLQMTSVVHTVRKSHVAMKQLSATDADFAPMLEVAGELLRERRIFPGWTAQIISTDLNDGGPSVLMQYRLGISAEEAAEMNLELVDRLVDRNLDRPGLYVGFVGAGNARNAILPDE